MLAIAIIVLVVVAALVAVAVASGGGVRAVLEIEVTRNSDASELPLSSSEYCTYSFDDVDEAGLPSFEALAAAGLVVLMFMGAPTGCACSNVCCDAIAPATVLVKGFYATALGVAVVLAQGTPVTLGGENSQYVMQFAAETTVAVVRLEVPDTGVFPRFDAGTTVTATNEDDESAVAAIDADDLESGDYVVLALQGQFNVLMFGGSTDESVFDVQYGLSKIAWRCNSRTQRRGVDEIHNEVKRKTKAVRSALERSAPSGRVPQGAVATLSVGATLASTFADVGDLFTLDFTATGRAGTIAAGDLPRYSVAQVEVDSDADSVALTREADFVSNFFPFDANRFTNVGANAGAVTNDRRSFLLDDTYVITFAKEVRSVYIQVDTFNAFIPFNQITMSVANGADGTLVEAGTAFMPLGVNTSLMSIVAPEGTAFDRVRITTSVSGFGIAAMQMAIASISTRG